MREEVAALRARLNVLTTLPLNVSDPSPLQAELGGPAKTPPRQMPLFGPVHGPPLSLAAFGVGDTLDEALDDLAEGIRALHWGQR